MAGDNQNEARRATAIVALHLFLLLPAVVTACDVRSYGAIGDGKTLDTRAIQKAIDSCNVVIFPRGSYFAGTITLKSDLTLQLTPAAVLLGSTRMEDYNPKHLIYAKGVRNIAIEGGGAIDGQGDSFFDKNMKPLARPSPLIEIWDSEDIRIEGVTIRMAPGWTLHPKNCNRVKIRGITPIDNIKAINSDGIDPDSSRNVTISDSCIEAGGDCIVLKTANRGGTAGACENVTVTNCVLVSAAPALKLGTESHGGFRHCVFSNCVIRNSRTGIALLAKDGGTMEDIRFSNITMQTSPKWGQGVEWPIVVDVERRAPESKLSHISDVSFSDIGVVTKGRILVEGMPESPIERLSFHNVFLRVTGYEKLEGVKKLRGRTVKGAKDNVDYGPTPAAIILAHAKPITIDSLDIAWPGPAQREVIFTDRVEDLRLRAIDAKPPPGAISQRKQL
jgi:Glycosyl hydrolases family 28